MTATQYNWPFFEKYVLAVGPPIGSVTEGGVMSTTVSLSAPVVFSSVQLAFNVVLFLLAVSAFIKHALESRRLSGIWAVNPLMTILVTDHTFYFLWFAVWQMLTIIGFVVDTSPYSTFILEVVNDLAQTFAIILGPRMVVALRSGDLKATEGISEEHVSTIRFGARDLPASNGYEMEPMSEQGPSENLEVLSA
ncbi:hypothetical protein BJ138DRAFT_1200990 [Hygrophoropsis aurantiaca]|uniref:Uncharacterized protein n=1 Tax=Hygrophoropsis aurantiaca TaxID=72124 RepID=A0ACB7ZQ67_9AGAM|nr:hypothetical protein BJ138DRAFT_1200990 [Hygrophoropsis aurantiaca]